MLLFSIYSGTAMADQWTLFVEKAHLLRHGRRRSIDWWLRIEVRSESRIPILNKAGNGPLDLSMPDNGS
jgi:hypothetical protein